MHFIIKNVRGFEEAISRLESAFYRKNMVLLKYETPKIGLINLIILDLNEGKILKKRFTVRVSGNSIQFIESK